MTFLDCIEYIEDCCHRVQGVGLVQLDPIYYRQIADPPRPL